MLKLLEWDASGLALLRALNTPEQKLHLGGPETGEKILDRHARYLTYRRPGEVEMLRIALGDENVGSIGYWETDSQGHKAYEMGWEILPRFHGRGIAAAAGLALIARLRPVARHAEAFAFPTPENGPSNRLCARLGFAHIGIADFEYPKGTWSPHTIWRLGLKPSPPPA
ncbi:MAG: GNAT family N-acetyltransferase [Devosia sp.]